MDDVSIIAEERAEAVLENYKNDPIIDENVREKSIAYDRGDVKRLATTWLEGVREAPLPKGGSIPLALIVASRQLAENNRSDKVFNRQSHIQWLNEALKTFFKGSLERPILPIEPEQFVVVKDFLELKEQGIGLAFRDLRKFIIAEKQLENKDNLQRTMVHKSLHILFPGFEESYLNEAVTEWLTEKIMKREDPKSGYFPRVNILKQIIENYAGRLSLEQWLIQAYMTGDISSLRKEVVQAAGRDDLFILLMNLETFSFEFNWIEGYFQNGIVMDVLRLKQLLTRRMNELALQAYRTKELSPLYWQLTNTLSKLADKAERLKKERMSHLERQNKPDDVVLQITEEATKELNTYGVQNEISEFVDPRYGPSDWLSVIEKIRPLLEGLLEQDGGKKQPPRSEVRSEGAQEERYSLTTFPGRLKRVDEYLVDFMKEHFAGQEKINFLEIGLGWPSVVPAETATKFGQELADKVDIVGLDIVKPQTVIQLKKAMKIGGSGRKAKEILLNAQGEISMVNVQDLRGLGAVVYMTMESELNEEEREAVNAIRQDALRTRPWWLWWFSKQNYQILQDPWKDLQTRYPAFKKLQEGDYRNSHLEIGIFDIVRIFNVDGRIDRKSLARLVREGGYVFIGYSRFQPPPDTPEYEKFTIYQKTGAELVPLQYLFSASLTGDKGAQWVDSKDYDPPLEIFGLGQDAWKFSREINDLLPQDRINQSFRQAWERLTAGRDANSILTSLTSWFERTQPRFSPALAKSFRIFRQSQQRIPPVGYFLGLEGLVKARLNSLNLLKQLQLEGKRVTVRIQEEINQLVELQNDIRGQMFWLKHQWITLAVEILNRENPNITAEVESHDFIRLKPKAADSPPVPRSEVRGLGVVDLKPMAEKEGEDNKIFEAILANLKSQGFEVPSAARDYVLKFLSDYPGTLSYESILKLLTIVTSDFFTDQVVDILLSGVRIPGIQHILKNLPLQNSLSTEDTQTNIRGFFWELGGLFGLMEIYLRKRIAKDKQDEGKNFRYRILQWNGQNEFADSDAILELDGNTYLVEAKNVAPRKRWAPGEESVEEYVTSYINRVLHKKQVKRYYEEVQNNRARAQENIRIGTESFPLPSQMLYLVNESRVLPDSFRKTTEAQTLRTQTRKAFLNKISEFLGLERSEAEDFFDIIFVPSPPLFRSKGEKVSRASVIRDRQFHKELLTFFNNPSVKKEVLSEANLRHPSASLKPQAGEMIHDSRSTNHDLQSRSEARGTRKETSAQLPVTRKNLVSGDGLPVTGRDSGLRSEARSNAAAAGSDDDDAIDYGALPDKGNMPPTEDELLKREQIRWDLNVNRIVNAYKDVAESSSNSAYLPQVHDVFAVTDDGRFEISRRLGQAQRRITVAEGEWSQKLGQRLREWGIQKIEVMHGELPLTSGGISGFAQPQLIGELLEDVFVDFAEFYSDKNGGRNFLTGAPKIFHNYLQSKKNPFRAHPLSGRSHNLQAIQISKSKPYSIRLILGRGAGLTVGRLGNFVRFLSVMKQRERVGDFGVRSLKIASTADLQAITFPNARYLDSQRVGEQRVQVTLKKVRKDGEEIFGVKEEIEQEDGKKKFIELDITEEDITLVRNGETLERVRAKRPLIAFAYDTVDDSFRIVLGAKAYQTLLAVFEEHGIRSLGFELESEVRGRGADAQSANRSELRNDSEASELFNLKDLILTEVIPSVAGNRKVKADIIHIVGDLPDLTIMGDWQFAFKIVLQEMLENAVRYSKDFNRKVDLQVTTTAETLTIRIRDYSYGIDPVAIKKSAKKYMGTEPDYSDADPAAAIYEDAIKPWREKINGPDLAFTKEDAAGVLLGMPVASEAGTGGLGFFLSNAYAKRLGGHMVIETVVSKLPKTPDESSGTTVTITLPLKEIVPSSVRSNASRSEIRQTGRSELRAAAPVVKGIKGGVEALEKLIDQKLSSQRVVTVVLFGGGGMGTTTTARVIKEGGLGKVGPHQIEVIDSDQYIPAYRVRDGVVEYTRDGAHFFQLQGDQDYIEKYLNFEKFDRDFKTAEQRGKVVVVDGVFSEMLVRRFGIPDVLVMFQINPGLRLQRVLKRDEGNSTRFVSASATLTRVSKRFRDRQAQLRVDMNQEEDIESLIRERKNRREGSFSSLRSEVRMNDRTANREPRTVTEANGAASDALKVLLPDVTAASLTADLERNSPDKVGSELRTQAQAYLPSLRSELRRDLGKFAEDNLKAASAVGIVDRLSGIKGETLEREITRADPRFRGLDFENLAEGFRRIPFEALGIPAAQASTGQTLNAEQVRAAKFLLGHPNVLQTAAEDAGIKIHLNRISKLVLYFSFVGTQGLQNPAFVQFLADNYGRVGVVWQKGDAEQNQFPKLLTDIRRQRDGMDNLNGIPIAKGVLMNPEQLEHRGFAGGSLLLAESGALRIDDAHKSWLHHTLAYDRDVPGALHQNGFSEAESVRLLSLMQLIDELRNQLPEDNGVRQVTVESVTAAIGYLVNLLMRLKAAREAFKHAA